METILITGINGFLGSNLAQSIKGEYQIIGVEYDLTNLFRLKNTSFEIYSSLDTDWESIFKKHQIDLVIHTATVYKKNDESIKDLLDTNIFLPIRLFELAQKYNAKAFINTDSFFNIDGTQYNYLGEYTLSKRHVLEWLKIISGSFRLINMKIFHMYGPGDAPNKFVSSILNDLIKNKEKISLTQGLQTRDFIYIDDVVDAYRKIINVIDTLKENIEIQVGTGKETSIKDFISFAKRITESKTVLCFGELPYRINEIMVSKANNSSLVSLGWQPKYDFKKGLSELVDYEIKTMSGERD